MSGHLGILGGAGGIGRVLVQEAIQAGYTPVVFDLERSIEAHAPDNCETRSLFENDRQSGMCRRHCKVSRFDCNRSH